MEIISNVNQFHLFIFNILNYIVNYIQIININIDKYLDIHFYYLHIFLHL